MGLSEQKSKPVTALDPALLTDADLDELGQRVRDLAVLLRAARHVITADEIWRSLGLKNPAKQLRSGVAGGTAAALAMTAEERKARARRGGNRVFYGEDGQDFGRASIYGRHLKSKQAKSSTRKR